MYRAEGQKLFQEFQQRMQSDVVHTLFHVSFGPPTGGTRQGGGVPSQPSPMKAVNGSRQNAAPGGSNKVGRNSRCPCGSGKKYKRCCGKDV